MALTSCSAGRPRTSCCWRCQSGCCWCSPAAGIASGRRSARCWGTGALLSPFVILLLTLKEPSADIYGLALLVWAGSVAVILWYVFVFGHIVRSALDTGLFTGVAIALTYVVASAAILTRMFPEGA